MFSILSDYPPLQKKEKLTIWTGHGKDIQDPAGVGLALRLRPLHALQLDEHGVNLAHNVLNDPLHAVDAQGQPEHYKMYSMILSLPLIRRANLSTVQDINVNVLNDPLHALDS